MTEALKILYINCSATDVTSVTLTFFTALQLLELRNNKTILVNVFFIAKQETTHVFYIHAGTVVTVDCSCHFPSMLFLRR